MPLRLFLGVSRFSLDGRSLTDNLCFYSVLAITNLVRRPPPLRDCRGPLESSKMPYIHVRDKVRPMQTRAAFASMCPSHFSLRESLPLLDAQKIDAEDLLPSTQPRGKAAIEEKLDSVPIVSHYSALFEPVIRSSAVLAYLPLMPNALDLLLTRPTADRRRWQRFVAVRISADDAKSMNPILCPDAIALIDRHYNSTRGYCPERPTLYAACRDAQLVVRYVDFISDKLVLRSLSGDSLVALLEIAPGTKPQDLIAGRVVLIQNPM